MINGFGISEPKRVITSQNFTHTNYIYSTGINTMSSLATLGKIDALLIIVDRALLKPKSDPNDGLDLSQNSNVVCRSFGCTKEGQQVDLYLLKNASGMEVEIINYGGHIRALRVPSGKSDSTVDVTIGLDNIFDYETKDRYFGSIVGRYANRICKGKFTLNGKEYQLPINNGPNSLHGGVDNFSNKVWETEILNDKIGISLSYTSPHMEQGYPGTCAVTVQYILQKDNNALSIHYSATTDAATVINLTNHAYFNLNGEFHKNSIADKSHSFQINADYVTPIDATSIPIGALQNVVNTPFDLRTLTDDLGDRIYNNLEDEQIKNGTGIDHNFVINRKKDDDEVVECAVVIGNKSGIKMSVYTSEPGVQLYTGNFLAGDKYGKGRTYDQRGAFCLETQHFPDSPNQKAYPSTVLNKGDVFKSTTRYAFSVV
eukprot:1000128_1